MISADSDFLLMSALKYLLLGSEDGETSLRALLLVW